MSYRFDINTCGGEILIYVWQDIQSKQQTQHKLPYGIQGLFVVEINLSKIKWLLCCTYCPPSQSEEHYSEAAIQRCSQEKVRWKRKMYSENMQQLYRRTPMPKYDFNKVARNFMFSCKFPTFLYSFSWEHLQVAASENMKICYLLAMSNWRKQNKIYHNFFLIIMRKIQYKVNFVLKTP